MNQVVVIWNLTGEATAPLNTEWGTPSTQYYSDPRWTYTNMGEVFGVTLDNLGNIFVASSAVYGTTASGSIYKIANGSGTPALFASLPNNHNGLGNITYDCVHDSFYVSNFSDGLIYQLNSAGTVVNTFDPGASLPTPITGANANLGRRPWGLVTHNNTLFMGMWNQDIGHSPGAGPNQIWSVALNSTTGAPIPSTMHLEITMPALTGHNFSSPVSDIRFTAVGSMLVAERSMQDLNVPSAHVSRALEFSPSSGGWVPSPSHYLVGVINSPNPTNSAGGIDFDFTPGIRFPVWVSGDALHFTGGNYVYGIQGFPLGGGDVTNSLLIDDDDYILNSNKTQVGEVRIPCPDCNNPPPAPIITGPSSMCMPGNYTVSNPQTGVTYTWTVTGGTLSSTTGTATSVNWSNTGSGSITVTTSGPNGCGPVTTTIPVSACTVNSCTYCKQFKIDATLPAAPVALGGGLEDVKPTVTSNMPGVISITDTLLSTSVAYSPASCGVSGPLGAYIPQASPSVPPVFNPPLLPVPNGNQVIWQSSSAVNLGGGVSTPFHLQLPAPQVLKQGCSANFSFCMSFSLANADCLTCTVIKCFGPFPYERGGPNPNPDANTAQPVEQPKTSKKKKLLHGLEKAAGSVDVGGSGGQGKDSPAPKDPGTPK